MGETPTCWGRSPLVLQCTTQHWGVWGAKPPNESRRERSDRTLKREAGGLGGATPQRYQEEEGRRMRPSTGQISAKRCEWVTLQHEYLGEARAQRADIQHNTEQYKRETHQSQPKYYKKDQKEVPRS